ncbi:MAG: terminase large subunit domain-containing protein [Streptosporangiaceae bacterium]
MTAAGRLDDATIERCIESPTEFSKVILGIDLFPFQREVAEAPNKYRVLLGGRQIGKSTLLSAIGLHRAWREPGHQVLIASTIDDAAKRLIDTAEAIAAAAPMLRASVDTDQAHLMKLSNGSVLRAIPSSIRQAIGWTVDTLIADEAGYLEAAFWNHLEPVIAARPDARVIIAGTPWGAPGHWFRTLYQRGIDHPDEWARSWKLPAAVSPLISKRWLDEKQKTMDPDEFTRTYLAEFTDVSGAYFTEDEIMSAVADYDLMTPQRAQEFASLGEDWYYGGKRMFPAYGGVVGLDWGYARDANAAVVLARLDDQGANDQSVFWIPWLESHHRLPYHAMVGKCLDIARGWQVYAFASELNGPGPMPTQELRRDVIRNGLGSPVVGVWTDQRAKMAGMGAVKGGLQRGTLILPRHPQLLSELRGLVYEQTESGGLKIGPAAGQASPDVAMALMQATRCMTPGPNPEYHVFGTSDLRDATRLACGTWFPARPRGTLGMTGFQVPQGAEKPDAGW